ncbi:MAG: hypothetical protein RR738_04880 [Anaerorhabdus sp.]|uniref:hypothetical protein n=1 Tax=Anaerorhabdus sp. TaxID=1872524 RepID=UPI002FC88BD1
MILGKIVSIDDANGLSILIDGEDTPTKKKYAYASTYVPHVGDRVAIEEIAGTYIVMFAIVDKFSECGIAKSVAAASNSAGGTDDSIQVYFIYWNSAFYISQSGKSGTWKKIYVT